MTQCDIIGHCDTVMGGERGRGAGVRGPRGALAIDVHRATVIPKVNRYVTNEFK